MQGASGNQLAGRKMRLSPLFEGGTQEKQLRTIIENVEIVGGRLYGNKEQAIADKLTLMEHAVKIKDEKEREAFVLLISKWFYVANVQAEAYKALNCIKSQLDTLAKKEAK